MHISHLYIKNRVELIAKGLKIIYNAYLTSIYKNRVELIAKGLLP